MASHADLSKKEKLHIVFIRPPRHFWPILNESDNFLLPLGYPSLAAHIRMHLGHRVTVEILDCCPHQIGWKSLETYLQNTKPDIVAVGEKTVYAHEGLRTFRLAKKVNPDVVTLAGGQLYSALPRWTFEQAPEVDYVIRYEGEIPLYKLLQHFLGEGGVTNLSDVPNLCYMDGGRMVETALGDPVMDLNTLAIPAYDLSGIDSYAPFGLLWPRATTIQRGRGCVDTCKFCSWIALEAKHKRMPDGTVQHKTFYRSKSVERVISEVELLYEKYGIRYLFWVDATWNVDSEWLDQFCDEIIRRKYKLGWWAFTRLDQALKQEKDGVLQKMVRAGLRHILTGVERGTPSAYGWLDKHNYSYDVTVEAFQLFKHKYPEVFRQGTFITGIREDNADSIKHLLKVAHQADCDFAAFHPITPFPGTPLYDEAHRAGWLEETDFSKYDMFAPVMATEHLTREEVSYWTTWCQKNFVAGKPLRYFSRMMSPHKIRRTLHWWFFASINRILARDAFNSLTGRESFKGFGGVNSLWRPRWYDS